MKNQENKIDKSIVTEFIKKLEKSRRDILEKKKSYKNTAKAGKEMFGALSNFGFELQMKFLTKEAKRIKSDIDYLEESLKKKK